MASGSWLRYAVSVAVLLAMALSTTPSHARGDDELIYGSIGGMGVGAAGIGIGVVLAAVSGSCSDEADRLGEELFAKGYARPCESDPAACKEVDDLLHERDNLADGAVIAVSVGAGLIALMTGTLIAGLVRKSGKSPVRRPTVVATRHGIAVQVAW
jgi:hypothetical protein